jgi:hypothetical protein
VEESGRSVLRHAASGSSHETFFIPVWKDPVGNPDLLKRIERFSHRRDGWWGSGQVFRPTFAEGERASSLAGNRNEQSLFPCAAVQLTPPRVQKRGRKTPSQRCAIPSRNTNQRLTASTTAGAQARDLLRCCPWETRYREPLGPPKQIPRPDNNAIEESAAISVRPRNSTSWL